MASKLQNIRLVYLRGTPKENQKYSYVVVPSHRDIAKNILGSHFIYDENPRLSARLILEELTYDNISHRVAYESGNEGSPSLVSTAEPKELF